MLSFSAKAWITAGALFIGASVFAVVSWKSAQGSSNSPPYTVAPVVRGDLVRSVNTTGQLTPWTSVEVSTQISGLVTKVNVDFNSTVKKGQILAEIDPSTFQQRVRQAEADLAAAKANHVLAELNARRLRGLRDKDLVTQQEYDQAQAQFQQSEAALLTSKAAVENARVDLERCTITSPIDGIVIFKQVEVGKTVVSSFSAPTLFVIAQDLTKMRIIAPISEVDIWSVTPGQSVTFTVDALPDRSFTGRLTQIRNPYTPTEKQQQQPQAQQSSIVTFDAVIEVDNLDLLLRPSLTANVSVVVERRENVLQIPNGALRVQLPPEVMPAQVSLQTQNIKGGSSATVYRLPNGTRDAKPEAISVTLGVSNSIVTEVLNGLKEGDSVVTGIASSWETQQRRRGFF